MSERAGDQAAASKRLPRAVWALGLTSLFMDFSSEMIHGLLPIYLTATLGMPAVELGLLEGLAEATSLAVKVVSGRISDYIGRRKGLALLGYGLAAAVKPAFPLATTATEFLAARVVDRLGKGLRGAPRDALIADVTLPAQRGRAYGLRQTLDTVGAVIGPLAAVALMLVSGGDIKLVFWAACIPALVFVLVLALFVSEPEETRPTPPAHLGLLNGFKELPNAFWLLTAFGGALAAARVSEAFLVLRAAGNGLPDAFAPLVLVVMSAISAACAYTAGRLIDHLPTRPLLLAAAISLSASEATLAAASGLVGVFAGLILWGAHIALAQVLFSTLVAQAAPPHLRATAFGVFGFVNAAAVVAGNLAFGSLYDRGGADLAYAVAAAVALAPLAILPMMK
jgi:MFS family permease